MEHRIQLVSTIAYGSAYGLISLPKGAVLTVKERNKAGTGIITKETVTLSNPMGIKTYHYEISDKDYRPL